MELKTNSLEVFVCLATFQNSRSICFDFRQQIDSIQADKPQKTAVGMELNLAFFCFLNCSLKEKKDVKSLGERNESKSVNKSYATIKAAFLSRAAFSIQRFCRCLIPHASAHESWHGMI